MFEYQAPVAPDYMSKAQADFDKQAARGLKKAIRVEGMSMKALRAELIREWTRTEHARAEAPTCAGHWIPGRERIVEGCVQEILIVHDGYEGTKHAHEVKVRVPISQWWAWVFSPEKACGQWSVWNRYDDWPRVRAKRAAQEEDMHKSDYERYG